MITTTMKKGLSLIEIMVVLIIIGILATLAVPNFANIIERNRIRSAEFNLKAIYNAEKRYKLNNETGEFYTVEASAADAVQAINSNLSLKIEEQHFDYTIVKAGNGYRAVATRVSGPCAKKTMSVSWDNNTVLKEECKAWKP